jgi:signal transduction histidine kinase/HAMP domain-containing protein
MPLRAKLATTFFILLLAPIIVLSVFSLDHAVNVMLEDLGVSADLMSRQVYEEMRISLAQQTAAAPETIFKKDDSIRMMLRSIEAFGPAIVHARIVSPDGRILVAATSDQETRFQNNYPPFSELQARAKHWWPLSMVPLLAGQANYEITRPVLSNGKLFETISIGVSTALIRAQIQQQVTLTILLMVAVSSVAVLSVFLLGNRLMRQLDALALGVERLTAGQTDVEVALPAPEDELNALAQKFNQLSRQLRVDRSRWDANRTPLFDVVKSLNEAVMLLDEHAAVLFANDIARSLLNLTNQGAIEGVSLSALLDSAHPLLAMVGPALEGNTEARDVAIRLSDSSKDDRSLLVSLFRLGQERKAAGLLIMLRDMQPVRELENVVEDSNRLARLGALISGVAHQLRNPLQGINLRLELLAQEVNGPGADRHIIKLRSEVQRLDQAVEALMRFMRPQALELSDFSINDLLTEQATHVRHDNIKVEFGLDPHLPSVHADRSMLGEALKNVVDNAVQAMPEGGTLGLKSKAIAGIVEVTVSDTGEGVAPEHLNQIFNLYFTTKHGGNGLGLPLALRAVELNRGTMELRSQPANGTSCIIRVPIAGSQQ